MYITRVEIENIKSIKHLVWEIDADKAAGWHVILGDNGAGKSTFIRSCGITLVGSGGINALQFNWKSLIARGEASGVLRTRIVRNEVYDQIPPDEPDTNFHIPADVTVTVSPKSANVTGMEDVVNGFYPLLKKASGWFSASYGPFRRFTGGDPAVDALYITNPAAARHITAFGEQAALTGPLAWLKELQFQKLQNAGSGVAAKILDEVLNFINQPGLLPNSVQMEGVTFEGVTFKDSNHNIVFVEELGDGYRSVLSMTLELIRQLSIAFTYDIFDRGADGSVTVKIPGVVQIDEVDAHLHPTWQRQIGFWLTKHFPMIQFIVTTHSPLVCQAAVNGSIFKLPTPGTDESGRMLEGEEENRLLYGDILDAYGTEAFGSGLTRSDISRQMLKRLGELNIKSVRKGLSKEEYAERDKLRSTLPSSASDIPDGKFG